MQGPRNHRLYERVTIADPLVFEMDQDFGADHDSAPACKYDGEYMTDVYARNYGDPGWAWEPSDCHDRLPLGFTDGQVTLEPVPIRAPHISELRERVNAQRTFYGLSEAVWTDAELIPWVTLVKAVHMTELRAALAEAYRAAGREIPVYTDGFVVAGVTEIRAVHLEELRTATLALEGGR